MPPLLPPLSPPGPAMPLAFSRTSPSAARTPAVHRACTLMPRRRPALACLPTASCSARLGDDADSAPGTASVPPPAHRSVRPTTAAASRAGPTPPPPAPPKLLRLALNHCTRAPARNDPGALPPSCNCNRFCAAWSASQALRVGSQGPKGGFHPSCVVPSGLPDALGRPTEGAPPPTGPTSHGRHGGGGGARRAARASSRAAAAR
jgi:hypothetical protein